MKPLTWLSGLIRITVFGFWLIFARQTWGQMMGGRMQVMFPMRQWLAGATFDGSPTQKRPKETPRLLTLGESTYQSFCTTCHGERGDGNGPEAKRLSVPARDFTRGVYKFRSTPTGQLPTDEDLFRAISRGVHSTAMMPWIGLSEQERWSLVAYLKTFSDKFNTRTPGAPVEIPPIPPMTEGLVEKGKSLYQDAGCIDCHGSQGRGDGPSAPTLKDDGDRPIRPRDFRQGLFKAGNAPEEIYRTLVTGLDGTPMSSYREALTPEMVWALVAYVRSLIEERPRPPGPGMMGMGNAPTEEQVGMMIEMHTMMGMGRMGRGMMR